LERGYSITRTIPDATIVKNSESVYLGQNLEVLLDKGSLTCRVGGKSKNGY
jgi:exonuclease VII large subunit